MNHELQLCVYGTQSRLDSFLHLGLRLESRALAQRLIEAGNVTINNKVTRQKSQSLSNKQLVCVTTEPVHVVAPDVPIIYQDDLVIVYNKPAGLLTHDKATPSGEATLAHAAAPLTTDNAKSRPGIVHRLDRGTSGVIIVARTPEAKQFLQQQFENRLAQKTYYAVVDGLPKESSVRLDWPIARNPKSPQKFMVHANGRRAVTDVTVERFGTTKSAVILQPLTGRTHQLRVHPARLGHPIVGDALYSGPKASRLYLHAAKLSIKLPSGEQRTFEAPLPADFMELWERPT